MIAVLVAILAFATGYAIRRGSICAVVAARTLVVDRRSTRIRAFALAAAASGMVILPLAWLAPDAAMLSPGYPVTWGGLAGGALFGLGARINDVCAMGTLAHLTGGRMAYAFTVAGMVAGAIAVRGGIDTMAPPAPSSLATPGVMSGVVLAGFVAVVTLTLRRRLPRWLRAIRDTSSARFGPFRAMLVVGLCSGLLYALTGGWSYLSVLPDSAARLVLPAEPGSGVSAIIAALILAGGGIFAAWRSGSFRLQPPVPITTLRCTIGGTLMGVAAAMIPGGNGAMLVYGLPSAAPHALAAYAAMTAVLCLSFLRMGQRNRKAETGDSHV